MFTAALALVALVFADVPGEGKPQKPVVEPPQASAPWTLDELFVALRQVESGGLKDGGRKATGDGGKALGPYQIHRAYWEDSKVPGKHEDCRDPDYARRVVLAYWKRYAKKALDEVDVQTLARVHNGGPEGATRESTLVFWRKVERELKAAREKRLHPDPPRLPRIPRAKKPGTPPPAPPPAEKPTLVRLA